MPHTVGTMSYKKGDVVEVHPPMSITRPNEGLTEVQIVDTDDFDEHGLYGVTNILEDLDYYKEHSKKGYEIRHIPPQRIQKFVRKADRVIRTPERRRVKKHGGNRRTRRKSRRRHRK